jgi:carbon-monoxide dehydrogenase medium subunit
MSTTILLEGFEYFEPGTIEEATSLLAKYGEKAKVIAGGTDLLVKMKNGEVKPKYLVNVKKIRNLNFITEEGGLLRIGATTSLRKIEKSQLVKEEYLVLFEAVRSIGTVQIRNMGTIGGNICNASPAADTASALLSLDARVKISSSRGERTIPLEKLFMGPGKTVLSSDELLTDIQIPSLPPSTGSTFLKIARVRADIAKINVATVIARKGDICKFSRIALGAVAPTPIRMRRAEEMLNGKKFEEKLVEGVAQEISEETRPISDVRSTAEYREDVSEILVKRALNIAWRRSGG